MTGSQRAVSDVPKDFLKRVRNLRRRLHRGPETAHGERRTAEHIQGFLLDGGLEPEATGIAGHGLLYRIDGQEGGPTRLLRADMDGLELEEQSGAEHSSETDAHHACGHDGHMAMLAGALVQLHEARDQWAGTVYGFFQPAEETGAGMEECLADDRLGALEPDEVYGVHNRPGQPLGQVEVWEGTMAVASVGLRFEIEGQSSHAAQPDAGRSPVPVICRIATKVPDAVDAALDGEEGAVATVVHIWAGAEHYGTSPGSGGISCTLRARSDGSLDTLQEHVVALAEEAAEEAGLEAGHEVVEPFPATVNHADAVQVVKAAAEAAGLESAPADDPFPWSEDFGHATRKWPGALVGLGAGEDQPALHSHAYDFPDELLSHGIRLWCGIAEARS